MHIKRDIWSASTSSMPLFALVSLSTKLAQREIAYLRCIVDLYHAAALARSCVTNFTGGQSRLSSGVKPFETTSELTLIAEQPTRASNLSPPLPCKSTSPRSIPYMISSLSLTPELTAS